MEKRIMARKVFNVTGDASTKYPFSHAVEGAGLVFLSGQPPLDLDTGDLINGDIASQVENCFKNLRRVMDASGLKEENVLKCTVFLIDMQDFPVMNEIYAKHFTAPMPARSCVAVAALPLGARVEVEMIAQR
jgi:2-iminobutanoate/2-iminopropanoate deaminase